MAKKHRDAFVEKDTGTITRIKGSQKDKRRLTDLLLAISNEDAGGALSYGETVMRKMWELVAHGYIAFDDPNDPEMERLVHVNGDQWLATVKWLIEATDGKPTTQMLPATGPQGPAEGELTVETWQKLVVTRRAEEAQTIQLLEAGDGIVEGDFSDVFDA